MLECEPTAILDNSTISETSRRLIRHDINRETFCSGGYGVINPILIEGRITSPSKMDLAAGGYGVLNSILIEGLSQCSDTRIDCTSGYGVLNPILIEGAGASRGIWVGCGYGFSTPFS